MELLIPIGVVIVLIIIGVIWYLTRPRPRCPECGSRNVTIMAKEPLKSRYFEYPSGGPGGGGGAMQLVYKVKFGCRNCHHVWTKEITETN
ncbi:MAG: hypothetical protein KDI02_04210 [Anaerolineae bacterium]|nr:hypothetical protein [Anaerolineae bacterium]MCB0222870.1 hypothetical protein [Anaerolineae bacterium]MCB9103474.1 hypothetical protein [Anaerolineales bacterium]